jgi:hypothetical protein
MSGTASGLREYEDGDAVLEPLKSHGWTDAPGMAVKSPVLLAVVILVWLVGGSGCSGLRSDSAESATVPIADVGMVSGKWKGTVKEVPGVFPAGTARLTIRENGTFFFTNDRLTDIGIGAGRLTQQDGMLVSDKARLHVTFRLYETHGTQTLVADGFTPSGDQFHAELMRED